MASHDKNGDHQPIGRRPSNFRRMFSTKSTDVTVGDPAKAEPLSAWLVLVATFLVNILIATADTVFGILYDYFTVKYDAPRAAVGWVLSAFAAAASLSGMLMSPFVIQYGCRPVGMAALFLLSLGNCLSAVAPNLPCLVMFYGVISGCGWGGIYLVTSTIIQQTFSCHRGLATGIAALGFTTGTILSPMFTDFLLREFSLEGALLLLGGTYAQGLVFAMILKSPKRLIRTKTKVNNKSSKYNDLDNQKPPKQVHIVNSSKNFGDDSIGCANGVAELELMIDGKEKTSPGDECQDAPDEGQPLSDKQENFVILIKNMLDFKVFRKVTFVLAIVYYLCFWMGRYVTLSQGVGSAIHQGISPQDAAYLLTIMGLCNLAIRLLSTFLLNCSWMNPVVYTSFGTIFLAGAGLFICWADTYAMFVSAMVCLGFSEGLAVTVMPMVVVHILGVKRFARGWSILWMGLLPGTMAAGPLSGWLVDVTSGYTAAFVMTTILGALATITAWIIHVLQKIRARNIRRKKTKNTQNHARCNNA